MECNKEEAMRAKELAEKMMESNDFAGAHKIAIKAQRLYPDLENISHIICVCDVHSCAEKKEIGGEEQLDWYAILKVEQSADDVSIKKQYRKLSLLLHPDKNRFAGAEAAFILVGQAQNVLLDKQKRSSFDAKYSSWFCQNPPKPPSEQQAHTCCAQASKRSHPSFKRAFQCRNPNFTLLMTISCVSVNSRAIRLGYSKKYLEGATQVVLQVGANPKVGGWIVNVFRLQGRDRLWFGAGWLDFVRANRLKVNDVCKFELINPMTHTYRVHIYRCSRLGSKSDDYSSL